MRTIVISDIHGYFDEFLELLNRVKYTEKDCLYLLGDYVDKGSKSKETVQYVMTLAQKENVKVIGGNHDDLFLHWLDGQDHKRMPYAGDKVAGDKTILSFAPFFKKGENEEEVRTWIQREYKQEIDFLRQLPYYMEDDHHIYVHAGINPLCEDWKETSPKDFRWIRNKFYRKDHTQDKTVVFGHTATSVLHEDENNVNIWFGNRKIGIDGGAKFGGGLHALLIENGEYTSEFIKVEE